MGIGCVLLSGSTLISGEVDSFWVLAGAQVFLGVFTTSFSAPAFSLLTDFFPANIRSYVNSILLSSSNFGSCLSSLSLLIIKKFGWREDFEITGWIGIFLGITLLAVVPEPERGGFDKTKKPESVPQ